MVLGNTRVESKLQLAYREDKLQLELLTAETKSDHGISF